jgi:hypothetical protein
MLDTIPLMFHSIFSIWMRSLMTNRIGKALRISAVLVLILGALFIVFNWMRQSHEISKAFEEPKITVARIDEMPFMRVPLGPNETYRPIEIMASTLVEARCEVVATSLKKRFTLDAFGKHQETEDCVFQISVPKDAGTVTEAVFRFYQNDSKEPIDTLSVPIAVIPYNESLDFQQIQDLDGNPVEATKAPQHIKVFAKTSMHLEKPKEVGALFFVVKSPFGAPVLQVEDVEAESGDVRPIIGKVRRYRRFGQNLEGYAVWAESPIQLGAASENKGVYDIYYGLFWKEAIPKVFSKTLRTEKKDDGTLVLTPLLTDIEQVRPLTIEGKLLSLPLHVVRNGIPAIAPSPQ